MGNGYQGDHPAMDGHVDHGGQYGRPRLVAEQTGLVVVQVGKSFRRRPVVRGVSLQVRRGEAVGLLGRTARAKRPAST